MTKHPRNGPTFSKAPPKKLRHGDVASPERRQAALEETRRVAADSRRLQELANRDPSAFLEEIGLGAPPSTPPEPPMRRGRRI